MAVHHTMCFVFTVLIICNAVLYPSIFSSIFSSWFGSSKTSEDKDKIPSDMPPQLRSAQRSPGSPGSSQRMEMERTAQRNMKHTGDPASYFAQQKQEASKGRGVMGSVLPVYAVGIVIYFAYIMYRIFLKDKSKTSEPGGSSGWDGDKMQDEARLKRLQQEQLHKQLSEQLRAENYGGIKPKKTAKASKTRVTTKYRESSDASEEAPGEVAALKKRLEDTERSMQRMMDMMNNMGIAMSQVTEQLTGAVPTGLVNSLNSPAHQEEDHEDEESNEEGQQSSEGDLNSDLDLNSDEDCGAESQVPDSLLTKTFLGEAGRSTDEDDGGDVGGDVEVIGGAETEAADTVRRRVVSAVGEES